MEGGSFLQKNAKIKIFAFNHKREERKGGKKDQMFGRWKRGSEVRRYSTRHAILQVKEKVHSRKSAIGGGGEGTIGKGGKGELKTIGKTRGNISDKQHGVKQEKQF